jgi:hypothetical protein
MSIPDGSRQRTSARSDSATRSVGRSRIDGASTGHLEERREVAELEAAVDQDGPLLGLGERDREVECDRRLADAALRREDRVDPRRAGRRELGELLADGAIRFIRSKPENGIASTPWMPATGRLDRVLRDRQDDDGTP